MAQSLLLIASSAAATVDVASADDLPATDANVDAHVVAVAADAADSAVTVSLSTISDIIHISSRHHMHQHTAKSSASVQATSSAALTSTSSAAPWLLSRYLEPLSCSAVLISY